jgi:hypothetical protein
MKILIENYKAIFELPDNIEDKKIIVKIGIFILLFLALGISIGRIL